MVLHLPMVLGLAMVIDRPMVLDLAMVGDMTAAWLSSWHRGSNLAVSVSHGVLGGGWCDEGHGRGHGVGGVWPGGEEGGGEVIVSKL